MGPAGSSTHYLLPEQSEWQTTQAPYLGFRGTLRACLSQFCCTASVWVKRELYLLLENTGKPQTGSGPQALEPLNYSPLR